MATRNARAEITLGALGVPDTTIAPKDNQAHAVWAVAHGSFRWSNLKTDPGKWQVYLLVGDQNGSWSAIGIDEGEATSRDAEGNFSVRGDLTAAAAYGSEDFQPNADGTAKSMTVPVAVMLVVRSGSGDMLTDAQASREVALTVEPGGTVSAVGGEGELVMQDDSDDPTPTASGGS